MVGRRGSLTRIGEQSENAFLALVESAAPRSSVPQVGTPGPLPDGGGDTCELLNSILSDLDRVTQASLTTSRLMTGREH